MMQLQDRLKNTVRILRLNFVCIKSKRIFIENIIPAFQ